MNKKVNVVEFGKETNENWEDKKIHNNSERQQRMNKKVNVVKFDKETDENWENKKVHNNSERQQEETRKFLWSDIKK